MIAAKAIRAAGRKKCPSAKTAPLPDTPTQHTGKCIISKDRPFGCRTHFVRRQEGPTPVARSLISFGGWKLSMPSWAAAEQCSLEPAIAGALAGYGLAG